jgi:hypothetical protein
MKQLYVANVDEVPDITLQAHEICDEVTSEEVVAMWVRLKKLYLEAQKTEEQVIVKTLADLRDYMQAAAVKNPLTMIDEFASGYRDFLSRESRQARHTLGCKGAGHQWTLLGVVLDGDPPITHCCLACGVYRYPSNVDNACDGRTRRLAAARTPRGDGDVTQDAEDLCVDEGCPQVDTAHVCLDKVTIPAVGTVWRHRDGELYRVLMSADMQTATPTIVFHDEGGGIWTRPLSEWLRNFIQEAVH